MLVGRSPVMCNCIVQAVRAAGRRHGCYVQTCIKQQQQINLNVVFEASSLCQQFAAKRIRCITEG